MLRSIHSTPNVWPFAPYQRACVAIAWINFYGVRYTNPTLASTASFLGRELHLYYNSQDLRTVRAFSPDNANAMSATCA